MADLAEANQLLQEAEQKSVPRKFLFFNSSPDYFEASELYSKAANAFKNCQEWRQAGECFRRAAEMDRKAGEADEAARKLLNAASCFKKADPAIAVGLIEDALGVLLRAGRFHMAAAQEKDIAEIYEQQLNNPQKAMEYYEKAASRYEGEDSTAQGQACRVRVAAMAANAGQFERAAQIYEDIASASASDSLRKYTVRDYLFRAGLCRLCQEDKVAAERSIEGYLGIDVAIGGSREYILLRELLQVLSHDDLEGFERLVEEFDRTSPLDEWKSRLLLRMKSSISEEASLT